MLASGEPDAPAPGMGVDVPGVDAGVAMEDLPFFATNLLPEPEKLDEAFACPTAAALDDGAMEA